MAYRQYTKSAERPLVRLSRRAYYFVIRALYTSPYPLTQFGLEEETEIPIRYLQLKQLRDAGIIRVVGTIPYQMSDAWRGHTDTPLYELTDFVLHRN